MPSIKINYMGWKEMWMSNKEEELHSTSSKVDE